VSFSGRLKNVDRFRPAEIGVEASKQANGLVEVQVVDVAAPFFVQELQDEQAQ